MSHNQLSNIFHTQPREQTKYDISVKKKPRIYRISNESFFSESKLRSNGKRNFFDFFSVLAI